MDFDIFVSKHGEFGQFHSEYADFAAAHAAYLALVEGGQYRRVTLYHFDTPVVSG